MYEKLLLSNKGGIITGAQLCEQDNCAVLAIGLGGTGCDCLRNLKAKVFNRVQPDDAASKVTPYKHIKFLAVDTDRSDFIRANDERSSLEKIDADTEFFDLSYEGDINRHFEQNANSLAAKPEYRDWLRFETIRVRAGQGASGVRQVGRYLLMEKAGDFINRVKNLITEAKKDLVNPKVYVHIFSGLGGGTGAGTFLDACYLVNQAIDSDGKNAFTCGYFFLPDVNLSNDSLDGTTAKFVRINGFASLQELDYCMNFGKDGNEDKWSQRYPGVGLIETSAHPVRLCHLIGAHKTNGDIVSDAYNYAINVVTDYFMDFLIKSEKFTLESHISNYDNMQKMLDKDCGANYEYCVLGASNATLPYKDVLTYLSSYMFGAMSGMRNNNAVTGDCDRFARTNGITYDALFNAAMREVNLGFSDPEFRASEAFGDNDLVTKHFSDCRTEAVGKATTNLTHMGRELGRLDTVNADGAAGTGRTGDAGSSTVTRIFYALNTLVEDPEKGPYYASALLNGTAGTDLVSLINGHIETVTGRINQLEFNLPDFERRRKAAAEAFEDSNVVNRGGRYNKFVDTTRALAKQYAEKDILYAFQSLLRVLKEQLVSLSNTYYRPYCNIITKLCDTFEANRTYLRERQGDAREFEYPITSITDENLRAALDRYLKEEFDIPSETKKFHQYMLKPEGYKAWKDNKENDIAQYISSYFSDVFSAYTSKGMSQYLYEKYGVNNSDDLIAAIRKDIMATLDNKAIPMYWADSTMFKVESSAKLGYTTVPTTSDEVKAAAANLQSTNKELEVRYSSVRDRITIMRCLVGAPLYGYSPVSQYETVSMADTDLVGKHLYEGKTYIDEDGKEKLGKDWRILPSPTPLSKMTVGNSSVLRNQAERRKELYEKAAELGIIYSKTAGEYFVRIIDDKFMEQVEQIAIPLLNSGDSVARYNAQKIIEQKKTQIQYSSVEYKIPNDARAGVGEVLESVKKLVRIDHFASMPVICAKVEAEIEKLKKIDQYIADLEPVVDHDFEDYANALFTGAIMINGIMLTYTDDFFNEVKLSAPNMQMGGMRLYQAFLNFKELDAGTKSKLNAISEKRNAMEEGMDIIISACTNVNAQLAQNQIAMVLQMASSNFPAIAGEIRDFYTNLQAKFSNYLMTYGIEL